MGSTPALTSFRDSSAFSRASARPEHVFNRLKAIGGNMKFTTLKGVKHGANAPAFNYTGDDPAKGYTTAYASGRPDKTEDIWDWLFKHNR